jgi:exodeoxyribonuclease III
MAPTRIISWNVNGIRAGERKGFLPWLDGCAAEVVALQEIKAGEAQLSAALREARGYHACWHPAERPGYSGVATLSRSPCPETVRGIGIERFDSEGRVLISRFPQFTLFNVYVPSGTTGPVRVAFKLEFTAALREAVRAELAAGRPLVLVGDLNTAHAPIDLARPRENQKTSGFMPEERAAFGELLGAGLVDSFRLLNPDLAKYSWWAARPGLRERNVGWRLDYVLVSADLAPRILAADTHPEVLGSDHCPVSVVLDL